MRDATDDLTSPARGGTAVLSAPEVDESYTTPFLNFHALRVYIEEMQLLRQHTHTHTHTHTPGRVRFEFLTRLQGRNGPAGLKKRLNLPGTAFATSCLKGSIEV